MTLSSGLCLLRNRPLLGRQRSTAEDRRLLFSASEAAVRAIPKIPGGLSPDAARREERRTKSSLISPGDHVNLGSVVWHRPMGCRHVARRSRLLIAVCNRGLAGQDKSSFQSLACLELCTPPPPGIHPPQSYSLQLSPQHSRPRAHREKAWRDIPAATLLRTLDHFPHAPARCRPSPLQQSLSTADGLISRA
ncbi:hypothetical protein Micbo1qcDRAFT_26760 [Microdochium bolleyi]|uniref:Uncharacterized protein n=1 Tax=Microdochium bolleyi TaxID=196109 RepID=A0A136JE89_9PEZI|nr:hypothetical protein Micbo1qcDRAFT_26760 [Microdochium bolleyi]